MKFNLKNRPTQYWTNPGMIEDGEVLEDLPDIIEDWFEGFEKELRECLEYPQNFTEEETNLIREILGET